MNKTLKLTVLLLFLVTGTAFSQTITLHIAIQKGDINRVRTMIDNGTSIHQTDHLGNTALTIAAYHKHLEIVRLLCDYGANYDEKDSRGFTPLMIAAFRGHVQILEYLISQGAYADEKDEKGVTALIHAIGGQSRENKLEMVKKLVMYGADINATDDYGRSALDYAKDEDIKQYLESMGALKGDDL